jgi:hypothetical protein
VKALRKTLFGTVSAVTALYLVRVGVVLLRDLARYERVHAMSDEPTMISQLPGIALQAAAAEAQIVPELLQLPRSVPRDIARFAAMKAM